MRIYKKSDKEISPLSKITCACGCNIEFQPGRIDQVYLNYRHANFAYNHGVRKKRYAEEKEISKIIRRNDRIMGKYYYENSNQYVRVRLGIVKEEGFNPDYFTKQVTENAPSGIIRYNVLFNYCYRIQNEIIEIHKI